MAEMMLVIGGDTCLLEDKLPGKVKSVVIDRDARKVTYLVVEPKGRVGLARFVPVDGVHVTVHPHHLWGHHADTLRLPYKEDGFKKLGEAEELFLPDLVPGYNARPFHSADWRGGDGEQAGDVQAVDGSQLPTIRGIETQTVELEPPAAEGEPAAEAEEEEEESSDDHLYATDGDIGRLYAICIDPGTHQVTHVHVLLNEGHHKEMAIPAENVSGFQGGIYLNLTQQQVQDLAVLKQ